MDSPRLQKQRLRRKSASLKDNDEDNDTFSGGGSGRGKHSNGLHADDEGEDGSVPDVPSEPLEFDLARLPNELLEQVFCHLDLRTFKSVRQTSRRFKAAADTRNAWSNFKVTVNGVNVKSKIKQVTDLLQFDVPWTNLLLLLPADANAVVNGNNGANDGGLLPLRKGMEKLAVSLRNRIELYGLNSISCPIRGCSKNSFYLLEPLVLSCSSTLASLEFLLLSDVRDKITQAFEGGSVTELPHLRRLKIAHDMDSEYSGDALHTILEKCGNLQRLEIIFADQEEHTMTLDSFEKSVVNHIVTYLEKRVNAVGAMRKNQLTINFASEGQKRCIPFDFKALQKFLHFSKSKEFDSGLDLRLENVPFLALPTKRSLQAVESLDDPEILERLNHTVATIIGTTHDLKMSTMEIERDSFQSSCRHLIPREAHFSLVVYLPIGNNVYLTHPSQLLPKDVIKSVTIVSENKRTGLLLSIRDDEFEEGSNCFIEDLLTLRPSLTELKILTETDKKLELPFLTQDSVNFKKFCGFKNFPHLKLLHLDYWGKKTQDYWELYESLPLLEELVLRKCYSLTDEGVVGNGNPHTSMLNLKNLKHLILDGYWSITDASFTQVFSKLKLRTLHVWDDPDKNEKSVTMKCLACFDKSVCGDTLESLKMNKPYKTSWVDIKKVLVRSCKSLKRVEVLETAGSGSKSTKHVITF